MRIPSGKPLAFGLGVLMLLIATIELIGEDGMECMPRLIVHDEALHEIDDRLFGQFLERASFGEEGPEFFVDPVTGRLPENMVRMLKAMEIPIIRFPGGTDIDYIDWRDMIDNVPGREGPRPVTRSFRPGKEDPTTITNHFGYDEYFALRDILRCETILVVNLLDGLAKRRPVDEAATLAAGLVAYVNAPEGTELPDGMPNWPAIRTRNGHPEPFSAEFIQIGNEMFVTTARQEVKDATGFDTVEQLGPWYIKVLTAYIKAIRAVDPDVKIIVDGYMMPGVSRMVQTDPFMKANLSYLARHRYAPGGCNRIFRGDDKLEPEDLTEEQLWWAWTSMPGTVDVSGQNQAFGTSLEEHVELGYQIAATEWNWNGWGWQGMTEHFEAPAAAGIGAAAFVHGLLRQGDHIKIATQSMLLGGGWAIAAIYGDPSGKSEPYYNPQGSSTTFYRKNHGTLFLRSELSGVETHPQPFHFSWGGGVDHEVAELDVVVTADEDRVFIHAINRNFDEDLPLEIDLSAFPSIDAEAIHHQLTFKLHGEPGRGVGRGMAQQSKAVIAVTQEFTVTLPARTVSILELDRVP